MADSDVNSIESIATTYSIIFAKWIIKVNLLIDEKLILKLPLTLLSFWQPGTEKLGGEEGRQTSARPWHSPVSAFSRPDCAQSEWQVGAKRTSSRKRHLWLLLGLRTVFLKSSFSSTVFPTSLWSAIPLNHSAIWEKDSHVKLLPLLWSKNLLDRLTVTRSLWAFQSAHLSVNENASPVPAYTNF